jgi:hypothetical protein
MISQYIIQTMPMDVVLLGDTSKEHTHMHTHTHTMNVLARSVACLRHESFGCVGHVCRT